MQEEPTLEATLDQQTKDLYLLWCQTYRHHYGVIYQDPLNSDQRKNLLAGLLSVCGLDMGKAKACVLAMFSEEMAWVTNISLKFLCKETNIVRFILPATRKHLSKAPTDWKAERSTEEGQCTIRRRQRRK